MNRVMSIYKKLSAPIKASLWFVVCNVIQKGIQVLTTPIFTRILTQEEYGTYSVYQSWYNIISVFATFNLAAGVYNNGLTEKPEEKDGFTSSLLGLSSTITVCLFFIYVVNIRFWTKILEMPPMFMFAMFVELIFVPAYSFWSAQQRYFYKYVGIIITSLIIGLVGPIIAVIAVLLAEKKAEAMVISFVFIQVAVGLYLYIILFARGRCLFNKKYWIHALRFNIPLIPHYLSQTVLNQSDRIMISRMVGTDKAAIYSVAYTVAMVMTLIISAISSTFTPYIYQSIKTNRIEDLRANSKVLCAFVCGMCLMSIWVGPELIQVIAAKEYYEACWIIPPVAASLYFVFVAGLYGTIEFYYEHTISVMVASIAAAVANLLLNYVCIKQFGYLAAGHTTLFCYIIMLIVRYVFYVRLVKKKNIVYIFDDKTSVIAALVMVISVPLSLMLYNYCIIRYILLVILIIILLCNRSKIVNVLTTKREK